MTNPVYAELRAADLARRAANHDKANPDRSDNHRPVRKAPNGASITRTTPPAFYRVIYPGGHPQAGQCAMETTKVEWAARKRREIRGYVTDEHGLRVMVK